MSDVSKVKLPDENIYNVKDEYLRHVINVLLGKESPNESDEIKK